VPRERFTAPQNHFAAAQLHFLEPRNCSAGPENHFSAPKIRRSHFPGGGPRGGPGRGIPFPRVGQTDQGQRQLQLLHRRSARIEGADQTGPDLSTIQQNINAKISGNHVEIAWGWGGNGAFLDMIELQVDRGQGYVLLAYDTTPGYIDTTPFPAAPAKWTYKAIYRVNDAQVGQWSKPVSVTVGG